MIFVDTSAFLAMENKGDHHHDAAIHFRSLCFKKGERLITNDYILDESYTIIRKRAGHAIAVKFGEDLRHSRLLMIEKVTPDILEAAWKIFKTFAQQDFSFTDCVSFAQMKQLRLNTAFTFDSDFKTYGPLIMKP